MKKLFLFILNSTFIYSQVGIGTVIPNSNSILHLESNNKGLLITRVSLTSTANPSPLSAHIPGMLIYNINTINDVAPGLYYNDGTKWVLANSNLLQSQLNNLDAQIPLKRAIIVAGQSNTLYGSGNIILPNDFSSKGMLQLARNSYNFQEIPLTFYNVYHHTQQSDKASFASMFCYYYYYYNELKVNNPNKKIHLLLIPCGAAGSGWTSSQYPSNSWRTDANYWNDLVQRIKWAKAQNYQIDAILWHQGETDAIDNTLNYKDILKNHIQNIRDQVGDQKLPFILGEMLPSWVASNTNYSVFQNIINNIPNEVPYTYTVSGSGLSASDIIHYSAEAHLKLGLRYYNGYTSAKLNNMPNNYILPATGQYLLMNHRSVGAVYFPSIFAAIRNDEMNPNSSLFSKLGDIWKYKNDDGYYHFKLETINNSGTVSGVFEWKQKFNPFGLSEANFEDRNDFIIINNTIGLNTNTGQSFASLVYDTPSNSSTFTTLFHADVRASIGYWYFPIGQTVNFSSLIPILESNNTINHIKFYAIRD